MADGRGRQLLSGEYLYFLSGGGRELTEPRDCSVQAKRFRRSETLLHQLLVSGKGSSIDGKIEHFTGIEDSIPEADLVERSLQRLVVRQHPADAELLGSVECLFSAASRTDSTAVDPENDFSALSVAGKDHVMPLTVGHPLGPMNENFRIAGTYTDMISHQ